jgi:hypothetical protein
MRSSTGTYETALWISAAMPVAALVLIGIGRRELRPDRRSAA